MVGPFLPYAKDKVFLDKATGGVLDLTDAHDRLQADWYIPTSSRLAQGYFQARGVQEGPAVLYVHS
ncbi:MAG: hypothetical protein AB7W28_08750 [Armatimonadota bacterium]